MRAGTARATGACAVSVNVSSQQFLEVGFADVVRNALEESGLAPVSLELEITESSLLRDVEITVNTLQHLKDLGVRLAIDDFGTGYSALAYLKRLPIDVLKIDQSFVRALTTDPADATITEAIVQLATGLNLTTIAEGVETLEQLLLLGSYGCSRMQGFLFGKPVPAETFEQLAVRIRRSSGCRARRTSPAPSRSSRPAGALTQAGRERPGTAAAGQNSTTERITFSGLHGPEGVVDLLERDAARDHPLEVELALLPQPQESRVVDPHVGAAVQRAHQLLLGEEQLERGELDLLLHAADAHHHGGSAAAHGVVGGADRPAGCPHHSRA